MYLDARENMLCDIRLQKIFRKEYRDKFIQDGTTSYGDAQFSNGYGEIVAEVAGQVPL